MAIEHEVIRQIEPRIDLQVVKVAVEDPREGHRPQW
jgi:hypothetical protein